MLYGFSFTEILILVLVALLFFKDQIPQLVGWIMGKTPKEDEMPVWAAHLTEYYNHDITDANGKIIAQGEKTNEKLDRLIDMEEKEHASAQELRDTLKDIGYTLKSIKENGVKCNDNK